jgi:hypothetical protein
VKDAPERKLHKLVCASQNLRLADPGSSVAVRDKNNQVEYLG